MSKREILLEKAEELILEFGYYQTGVNELIQATGISKGSLYYYFPKGKEALFALAVSNLIEKELKQIESFCDGKVQKSIHRIADFYLTKQKDKKRAFIFGHMANELKYDENHTVSELIKEFQADWLSIVSDYLKKKKIASPKRKSKQFYVLLLGLIQMNDIHYNDKNEVAFDEILDRLF